MKAKLLGAIFATVFIAACAGLNVSWNASYNMAQIAKQVNVPVALPALPVK